jgi:hypothetical protein
MGKVPPMDTAVQIGGFLRIKILVVATHSLLNLRSGIDNNAL